MASTEHHTKVCQKRHNPFLLELERVVRCAIRPTSKKKIRQTSKRIIAWSIQKTPRTIRESRSTDQAQEIEKIIAYWSKTNAQKFSLEFDDLFTHGMYIVAESLRTHDPNRGKLIDHIFNRVKRELYKYALKEAKRQDHDEIDEWSMVSEITPESVAIFQETLRSLGPIAQQLVILLLSHPREVFASGLDNASIARKRLVRKAQELYGGEVDRWYKGLQEIQKSLGI